jgi:uncharacterized SAM-binding protein YcdF (DUF218 family)
MDSLFFILSKIGWAFLSPGNLLLIAFIFGSILFFLNYLSLAKKILAISSIFALAILSYPLGDFIITPLEKRFAIPQPLPDSTKIDGILMLGGGEDLKRSLSWQSYELGLGGDRYITTKYLANHYPNLPVIFAGGSGHPSIQDSNGEGSLAHYFLTTIGITEERLIIESSSRNTYENFLFIKPKLPDPNGTYLLVTSAFHMPRSVGIARKLGINVIAYPTDFRSNSAEYRKIDFDFFDHLKSLEPAWKEWIGLTIYYITDKTSSWFPKPREA